MKRRQYIINPSEAETYVPPLHKQTLNYRLAGKGGLQTENLEIVLGLLKKGSEAEYHLHRNSEQALFVLEGECDLETRDGFVEKAYVGDLMILPKGLGHRILVTSEVFRALVIYSPKLNEKDIIAIEE
jgi:quercetin dioxygenase-like cupin family protein